MEKRKPKKTDQQQVQKAFDLLSQFIVEHDEIEPTLWASAFWSILVAGYVSSGMSYDKFTKEWNQLKYHYKSWFDE